MATPTYIPLATTTLASSASSVSFGSIPQNYRDLVLVQHWAVFSNTNFRMRFNNDSANIYSNIGAGGNTTAGIITFANTNMQQINQSVNSTEDRQHLVVATIFDYSTTDKHKSAVTRLLNAQEMNTYMLSHRYASTNAINSIVLSPDIGDIQPGSTFSLYGIEA